MSTTQDQVLTAALECAGYGWLIVPLENGRSKRPVRENWPEAATTNEEQIEAWWRDKPGRNFGVLLGPKSGLVDFEADGPDADSTLAQLFGGEFPITPTYKARRGKHRLFKWRDDLPEPHKNAFKIGSLEVRTGNGQKAAQSVFPPSRHPEGMRYEWVLHPSQVDVAEIPDDVVARCWNALGEDPFEKMGGYERKPKEHWERIFAGIREGSRHTDIISYIGKMLFNAQNIAETDQIEVVYQSIEAVNERCKPPLPADELRRAFSDILKRERTRRATADSLEPMRPLADEQVKEAAAPAAPGEKKQHANTRALSLVIVRGEPPKYELHGEIFSRAMDGCIELTAEQLVSGDAIRIQALKQAEYPLKKSFVKAWNQGLYEALVENANFKEADSEDRRDSIIAELLLESIERGRGESRPRTPTRRQLVVTEDGDALFHFRQVWTQMNLDADRITRNELSRLLKRVGATWEESGHVRFKKLTPEAIKKLERIANADSAARTAPI